MIYLKRIVGGILASVIFLIAYGVLVASRYRGRGIVAIPLFAPLRVAVILLPIRNGGSLELERAIFGVSEGSVLQSVPRGEHIDATSNCKSVFSCVNNGLPITARI